MLRSAQARISAFFSSRDVALGLFSLLILILIPSTVLPENDFFSFVKTVIRIILTLIGLSLCFCTWKHRRHLSAQVLLLHVGSVVVLLGGVLSSFGYVATVNIYEGDSTDLLYRWDLQRDVKFAAEVKVNRINREYYPVEVKVGVLKNEEQYRLVQLKTGERFSLDDYQVRLDFLEPAGQYVTVTLFKGQEISGPYRSEGLDVMPPGFPYAFRLVAYKTPALKNIWLDLSLSMAGKVVAHGASGVNRPFIWQGLRFFNTSTDMDENGRPYAGIQVVHDPGILWVYLGFSLLGLGGLVYLCRGVQGLFRRQE